MKSLNKPLFIAGLLLAGSLQAVAATDYSDVKRDIRVMSEILQGAYESEADCDFCRARIKTRYLAEQGAVFEITPPYSRAFSFSSANAPTAPDTIRIVKDIDHIITNDVTEILADVDVNLDGLNKIFIELEDDGYAFETTHSADRETRDSLRKLRQERRQLANEMRARELEKIHASKDTNRDEINNAIEKIAADLEKLEQQQASLNTQLEQERMEKEKARTAAMAARAEQTAAKLAQLQQVTFKALCDYGATLKHLPRDEHVSMIFAGGQRGSSAEQVFIVDSSDVAKCSSAEKLRNGALNYPL